MGTKLRILLLEDNETDAEVVRLQLKAAGYNFQLARVQSEAELRHEMDSAKPDLVLSDHGLPSFDGFRALQIVREQNPELPFIFVSGSNDQGMVARMYEAGATDYVFKNDIRDLPVAVREALEPDPKAASRVEPDQPQAVVAAFTHIHLCSCCLRARDDNGHSVDFLEFLRSGQEIVVLHELCPSCQPVLR